MNLLFVLLSFVLPVMVTSSKCISINKNYNGTDNFVHIKSGDRPFNVVESSAGQKPFLYTSQGIENGCLVNRVGQPISGFVLEFKSKTMKLKDRRKVQAYVFTFGQKETVNHFSLNVYDYGDYSPYQATDKSKMMLKAFDKNNKRIKGTSGSSQLLVPQTKKAVNGDACTQGVHMLSVEGEGIYKVVLTFKTKLKNGKKKKFISDPFTAFGSICYNK